jgi:MATE family multidrug resistance protein
VVLNYVLIYGEEGLPSLGLPGVPGTPRLGVYGAAVATVCGGVVEMLIPAAVFLCPRMHRELGSRSSWRPRWKPVRDLVRVGWPASVQFGNELICWAIFMSGLVGLFGADHMTAGWIALAYMHLSFMPAVGLSVATTSLVGRYIGAGQPDVAAARARLTLRVAVLYMTACALLFFLFRAALVGIFIASDLDPERASHVHSIGVKLLICAAVFQTADAVGIIYSGALRGAGDTVWPGAVTVVYSWVLIVGGGWAFTAFWPQIESIGPWLGATAYIIAYGLTMAVRFERGSWRSINLLGRSSGGGTEPAEVRPAAGLARPALEAAPDPPETR